MFEQARRGREPTRAYKGSAFYGLVVALTACSFPDPSFVDEPGAGAASGAGAAGVMATGGGKAGGGASSGGASSGAPSGPTVLATGQGDVRALAADADALFWVSASGVADEGDLRSVSTAGGSVQIVIAGDSKLAKTRALALDSGTFFLAYDRDLYQAPRAAPVLESIFDPTDVSVLLLGAADMYLGAPWGVSRLSKLGPLGGDLIVLAGEGAQLLALEGETALVLEPPLDGESIRAVPGDGATPLANTPVVLQDAASVSGFAFDDTGYFWTRKNEGTVEFRERTGTQSRVLAQGESLPHRLAVTSAAVYWITDSGRALRRLPKGSKVVTTLGSARPDLLAHVGDLVAWVSQTGDVMAVHD